MWCLVSGMGRSSQVTRSIARNPCVTPDRVDPKTSVRFKVTQFSIGDVTGDWTGGKFSGTVKGNTIKYLTLKRTVVCSGTFTGTATVSGRSMSFTFTGYNCCGDSVSGQGTATKQ